MTLLVVCIFKCLLLSRLKSAFHMLLTSLCFIYQIHFDRNVNIRHEPAGQVDQP